MEFFEKARIRLQHWIKHSDEHTEEYRDFARKLEDAGKSESAKCIREVAELSEKSSDTLRKALNALE